MNQKNNLSLIIFLILIVFNLGSWYLVFFSNASSESGIYFLDVGQGDSSLLKFGGAEILIDAGPNSKVIQSLGAKMLGDKYIDLGVITHPELDHFNGFNYLLSRYNFGAFIINGRRGRTAEWSEFLAAAETHQIPVLTLGAGDKISYNDNEFKIISPSVQVLGTGAMNDTSLVGKLETRNFGALFLGDISESIEKFLIQNYELEFLRVEVLKIAHHGSKFSSNNDFLKTVAPKIALIGVGASNTYGHPTPQTLERLTNLEAKIFRTDLDGTIVIREIDDKLKVFLGIEQ